MVLVESFIGIMVGMIGAIISIYAEERFKKSGFYEGYLFGLIWMALLVIFLIWLKGA
jgi:hypothetical protein